MNSLKVRIAAALGAAFLASAFVISASPAMASAQSCGQNVANLVDQCAAVSGSGLHINHLSGWAVHDWWDVLSYPQVHEELYGPRGHIKNCSVGDFPPGDQTPTCTWSPNASEPAGEYCSRTWSLNGTKWEILATDCIYVHA
jgi:hypothetical protein